MNDIARRFEENALSTRRPMTLDNMLERMFTPFSNLMPELMGNSFPASRIEIEEGKDSYTAKVPMPGCKAEDFGIEVVGNMLTVRMEHKEVPREMRENGNHFIRRERSYESYEETVNLPGTVDGAKATASYKDGILAIVLPRQEKKNLMKKIEVK